MRFWKYTKLCYIFNSIITLSSELSQNIDQLSRHSGTLTAFVRQYECQPYMSERSNATCRLWALAGSGLPPLQKYLYSIFYGSPGHFIEGVSVDLSATQHRQHGTQSGARLQYPRLERRPDRPWTTIKEIHEYAKHLENGQKDTRTITVTGRIISKRESSAKLVFYDLVQDGKSIQVMASAGRWEGGSSFAEANQVLSRGDVVEFTGVAGKTNKGQISMIATKDMRVLAPCLHNIPRTGLKDPEKRFRQRHLDMLVNPKVTEILRTRSQVLHWDERTFLQALKKLLIWLATDYQLHTKVL